MQAEDGFGRRFEFGDDDDYGGGGGAFWVRVIVAAKLADEEVAKARNRTWSRREWTLSSRG